MVFSLEHRYRTDGSHLQQTAWSNFFEPEPCWLKQQDPDPQNMNVDPPVFLESDHQDGGRAADLAGGQESDPEQSDQAAQAAAAAAATADPPGFSSWPRNDRWLWEHWHCKDMRNSSEKDYELNK